jgi:surfactin family lipopeptide synthetase A/lichenysin synthetase A
MIPSAWIVLAELPLTRNGKVDRAALPGPQGRPEEMRDYIAPRNETERALAEIWSELLLIDRIGAQDNFFELGGHSLHGLKLIARIQEHFNVSMSPIAIFQYPSVEQMAPYVKLLQSTGAPLPGSEGIEFEEGLI